MFSLKFCKTRGFVPNTLFLKGLEALGIHVIIYLLFTCVYCPRAFHQVDLFGNISSGKCQKTHISVGTQYTDSWALSP